MMNKEKTSLFTLNTDYKQYLKIGKINEELRKAFKRNKIALSDSVWVFKINENGYFIVDRPERGIIKFYVIKETDKQLNIYTNQLTISNLIGWNYDIDIREAHYSASFESLKKHFKDINEFDSFVSKISEDELNDFLDAMTFYFYSKKIKNQHPKFQALQLIMIFSAIERIMSKGKEYQDFYHWIVSKENKKKIEPYISSLDKNNFNKKMKDIYDKYNEEFGSIRKVKNFFIEYLDEKDQNRLIQGFTFHNPQIPSQGNPSSFRFKIKYNNREYITTDEFEKQARKAFKGKNIPLSDNAVVDRTGTKYLIIKDSKVDCLVEDINGQAHVWLDTIYPKNIEQVAKIMYGIRNQFVHKAQFPQSKFREDPDETPVMGSWTGTMLEEYMGHGFKIIIPITEVKEIFERGVLKFYGMDEKEK